MRFDKVFNFIFLDKILVIFHMGAFTYDVRFFWVFLTYLPKNLTSYVNAENAVGSYVIATKGTLFKS